MTISHPPAHVFLIFLIFIFFWFVSNGQIFCFSFSSSHPTSDNHLPLPSFSTRGKASLLSIVRIQPPQTEHPSPQYTSRTMSLFPDSILHPSLPSLSLSSIPCSEITRKEQEEIAREDEIVLMVSRVHDHRQIEKTRKRLQRHIREAKDTYSIQESTTRQGTRYQASMLRRLNTEKTEPDDRTREG